MKKERIVYISVITVLLALLIGCVAVGADFVGGFSRLDLDENGRVDISDVTYLLNYLSKGCAHEETVTDPGTPATCTEAGLSDGRCCKVCGEILAVKEEIPALGHNFVNGFCSRCGRAEYTPGLVYELADEAYTVTGYTGIDKEVYIPAVYNGLPVTAIGSKAFYENDGITLVEIPEGITAIGDHAFYYCTDLREVVLPSTLTTIGVYAFYNCESLATADLPANLTSIGYCAFYYCESLRSVIIPEGVTEIPYGAFDGCFRLSEVVLPETLTYIDRFAFYGCSSLHRIRIPSDVSGIGDGAFEQCFTLIEIINDSDLTLVPGSDGNGCAARYAIEVHSGESRINRIGDYLFYTAGGVNYMVGYAGTESDLVLPANCGGEPYELIPYLFYSNYSLHSLVIPEGITVIPDDMCMYCDYLLTVSLPSTVTSIGTEAFYSCDRLMSVNIPMNTVSIGRYAFSYCYKLFEVVNNSSLELVRGSEDYGCVAYYAISIHNGISVLSRSGDFFFLTEDGVHYLIGCGESDREELVLPTSYWGENYEIGPNAFEDSVSLRSVIIPACVTAIGDYAFAYCGLESVIIPDSVVSIGYRAFYDCEELSVLKLGSGVRSIGENVFRDCYMLTDVTIPDGVETIPDGAFMYCAALKTVTIPASVTEIEEDAFYNCGAVTDVYFGGSAEQWDAIEIGDCNESLTGAELHFNAE